MELFKQYKISDILIQYRLKTFVTDKQKYRQVTITNDGTVKLRGEKFGKNIGRKRQFIVDLNGHPNTIIFIRQTIRDGGIGLATKEVDGCVVTENFPMFDVKLELALPSYLHLFFRSNFFKQELNTITARGTAQKAIHEDKFLNLSIPLPSIQAQKEIVKKLSEVKVKCEQVEKLIREQQRDFSVFQNSIFNKLLEEESRSIIGKHLVDAGEACDILPAEFYRQVTVRLEHKGVLLRKLVKGIEIGSVQTKVTAGNFIISKIDARNGAMGFIPESLDGAVVTNDFPVFNFTDDVNPKYFGFFANTRYFDQACKKASEGSTNRVRLKMDKFYNIEIPLPDKERQTEIVSMLDKIHQIKSQQHFVIAELKALFPSVLDKAFKGE